MLRKLALTTCIALFTLSAAANAGASTHRPVPWFQPLLKLPSADLLRAQCVIAHESRSTFTNPNLGDDNGNGVNSNKGQGQQSGIFQMSNGPKGIWDLYVRPTLHVVIWKATAYQQALGFMLVWQVDRFGPWHAFDGC